MSAPLSTYVKRLLLRSSLDAEEQDALLAVPASLTAKKGGWDLVRPNDRTRVSCLVKSGLLGRAERFADGSRGTTMVHLAGDMADIHSMVVPVAGWIITALTDCEIYEVPHDALLEVATRYPRVAQAMWRDSIADASIMSKWISVLNSLPAKERLAHILCELSIRMNWAGLASGDSFELDLTQDQLSEIVGTTPVHMNRTFRALREENAILTRRGRIIVNDAPALRQIANFDPSYLLKP